jgi:hypothetical protein
VCRRVRFGRGRPSAQLPLVVALAKRHAPRAQDVIGGDGVEMKVGQRKGKKESLRRESELSRRPGRGAIIFVERAVEGNVQRLAGPAIARFRLDCGIRQTTMIASRLSSASPVAAPMRSIPGRARWLERATTRFFKQRGPGSVPGASYPVDTLLAFAKSTGRLLG